MRPVDLTVDEKDTVWPGLHSFRQDGAPGSDYSVVWWDPRARRLVLLSLSVFARRNC